MRHNTEYINKDFREIENTISSLSVKDISIPQHNFSYLKSRPIVSSYANFFPNFNRGLTTSQKRIFSFMMSVPAFAVVLAFVLWSINDDGQIYLATNDVRVLEESNNKIIDKINSLDNVYEK